jgi:hypothetical protein
MQKPVDRIELPKRGKGRLSAQKQAEYDAQVERFCAQLKEIRSTLDFSVSARGWCYILEEHGLLKSEFDKAQHMMLVCRKSGQLPLNFCADDDTRSFDNLEQIDEEDAEEYAQYKIDDLLTYGHEDYIPFSFWEDQKYYVEMWVEKIDLKSLFTRVCEEFHVPIASVKGWADFNTKVASMQRFEEWEGRGNKCVLLHCGDHDPAGLQISDTIRSNMEDLSGAVGWAPDDLIIERFGLNYEFIQRHRLSWIENLETSSGKYPLDDERHEDHLKPYVTVVFEEVRRAQA